MLPGHAATPLRLLLKAPLSGVLVPIDQVPDAVFAQRMVGDGVSIDPTSSCLLAPCAGRIVQIHPAAHALTVLTDAGIEVLMHIGIDTVQLKGRGFTARVQAGDRVAAGDPLIDFDADDIANHATSLLTQIVITNAARVASMTAAAGVVTAGADTILDIVLVPAGRAAIAGGGTPVISEPLVVGNPSGLHARPAAVVAAAARQFRSEVTLRRAGVDVNARSVVAILGLEVLCGDIVAIVATGPDATEAVAALSHVILDAPHDAPAATLPQVPATARHRDPDLLVGIAASPGVAVGTVWQLRHEPPAIVEDAGDARQERRTLEGALDAARAELAALETRLRAQGAADHAAIFAAHRVLLEDPELLAIAMKTIDAGRSAAFAWHAAVGVQANRLAALKSQLLAGRAQDVRDVGRRVLRQLTSNGAATPLEYPADTILVAEELTPSDTANVDRSRVLGVCTTTGGASSHAAILARSLDLPFVAGVDPSALALPNGTPVVLDGFAGTVRLTPSAADIEQVRSQQAHRSARRRAAEARAGEPAVTRDGHVVSVGANIGSVADAEQAVALGADGVGLLRTEFLFLERTTAPGEAEQEAVYVDIARVLGPARRLVIRTLDVGGDKPPLFLPIPREANPFLGERGIRVLLNHPELLRAQLRAILRASTHGAIAVMFPMVSALEEWRAARAILDEEHQREDVPRIAAGVMVEVASAALLADHFAREVSFFSIGTNDLTQYTLAIDRGHTRLAPQADSLSPAVLRLIAQTTRAASEQRRPTSVCGAVASDEAAIPILIGLGVHELSVAVPAIPAVKAQIRELRLDECRRLAEAALTCGTAGDVRALVAAAPAAQG